MDVFYYWRDYDPDLKAGRIGWLPVSRKKLEELRDRHPDWIWVFRRPKDRKDGLQLLARLRWADAPLLKLPIEKGTPAIYYDPAASVRFTDTAHEGRIAEVTSLIRIRFPNAFLANFRGDAGVQAMEADLVAQLAPKLAVYPAEPFPAAGPPAPAPAARREAT